MLNVEWDCEVLEQRSKSVPVSSYDVKYMAPEYLRFKKIGTKYDIWWAERRKQMPVIKDWAEIWNQLNPLD